MKRGRKLGLNQVLALIESGNNPAKICRDLDVPKQSLDYYVGKLKQLGCIEKKGYGTWMWIKDVPVRLKDGIGSSDFKKKEIRGHAFIWKIVFFEGFDWEKVILAYQKKKLTFQRICRGVVFRTIFNNRKIWLTKSGLVIYEPIDFLGRSSLQVKGMAVFEMDKLVKDLLRELNQKFRYYKFTTSREHYAIIRNELARQYNDKKEKMYIKNEAGSTWLWIDHSEGEQELESNEVLTNRRVQNFWNDNKKHKFQVTPSFVLDAIAQQSNAIKRNAEHLEYHAENMRSHVGATRELRKAAKEISENLKKQNQIFERISNKLK